MKTPYRLICSLLAFSIGIILAGIGVFEVGEGLPSSAYMMMAFMGAGLVGLGVWQFLPLLSNWRQTQHEITFWARQSPKQALGVGLFCIAIGITLSGVIIWTMSSVLGSDSSVRTRPLALAIVTGAAFIWLGITILRAALFTPGN